MKNRGGLHLTPALSRNTRVRRISLLLLGFDETTKTRTAKYGLNSSRLPWESGSVTSHRNLEDTKPSQPTSR